jgi:hypothetical protein
MYRYYLCLRNKPARALRVVPVAPLERLAWEAVAATVLDPEHGIRLAQRNRFSIE